MAASPFHGISEEKLDDKDALQAKRNHWYCQRSADPEVSSTAEASRVCYLHSISFNLHFFNICIGFVLLLTSEFLYTLPVSCMPFQAVT